MQKGITAGSIWFRLALGLLACSLVLIAHADDGVDAYEEYGQRLNAAQTIGPLSDSVFGDSVNLYDGSTTFDVTDVSLPGNNALPVVVARRFVIRDVRQQPVDGDGLQGFNDWDLDVPYIDGTFTQQNGWELLAQNQPSSNRCSDNTDQPDMNVPMPPNGTATAPLDQIWNGNHLHIPGQGDQDLLANTQSKSPAYASAGSYPWVTTSNWRVGCTSSVANMTGQGFVAVSPSGVQYTFNYAVVRPTTSYIDEVSVVIGGATMVVPRVRIFLLATQVQDRFGNWVKYNYSNGQLTGITSSDGRTINVNWSGNEIATVTSEPGTSAQQTWHYGYATASWTSEKGVTSTWPYLNSVTRPDGSQWTYTVVSGALITNKEATRDPDFHPTTYCQAQITPDQNAGSFNYRIGAPSGAVANYTFQYNRSWRSYIPRGCVNDTNPNNDYPMDVTAYFDNFQLLQKQITGPGLATETWTYSLAGVIGNGDIEPFYFTASVPFYDIPQRQEPYDPPGDCSTCEIAKIIEVAGPANITKYTFGVEYAHNEGQLLQVEMDDLSGHPLKTTTYTYVSDSDAANEPFANLAGYDLQSIWQSPMGNRNRPIASTQITQDGATFTTSVNTFDAFARAISENASSSLGYSKTDTTSYQDDLNLWVLGLTAGTITNGITTSQTTYTSQDLPYQHSAFGKLVSTKGWNSDGTLASVTDGDGNATNLSNWYRGLPQSVGFADGTSESAAVNAAGWITSITDEYGFTTHYTYDAMGRLSQIGYPAGDDVAWNPTLLSFTQVAGTELGIPGGHWKQVVQTGNDVAVTYFDAFWRPLVTEHYDAGNQAGTLSQVVTNYDAGGREIFTSYPTNSATSYTQSLPGAHTSYDALNRVTEVEQDSELGGLPTTTKYLSGFQTQVTDPRGYATVTSYMAFGEPTTQWPMSISAPTGEFTTIQRDVFGKPLSITRTGTASGSPSLTRTYIYDGYQQLCKRIEPESGATAFGYDGAGNLVWSAAGLDLPDASCDTNAAEGSGRVVSRTYDKRNRLLMVSYPDGSSSASFGYYPDGALHTQTTSNNGNPVTTDYYYDKRRLLTSETLSISNTSPFTLRYGYDANGHLASTTYPDGRTVGYAPNALGQSTMAGAYAGGVTYYPNGAIASFTYGNGLVHTMAENERGLVDRSADTYSGAAVHDDTYAYDGDDDVAAITDNTPGNVGNRDMTYDALDRLTEADSPMFGSGGNDKALYQYDVLDNLLSASVGSYSSAAYSYNADGQLVGLVEPGTIYTLHTYSYDVQGNLANKDGQLYQFDMANRLRNIPGVGSYLYDAAGRRVQKNETLYGGILLDSDYSKAGQLMYQWQPYAQNATDYIYLGDTLVARVVANNASSPPPNVPSDPASITVTPASNDTGNFSVSWSASSGATSYVLWQKVNNGSADSVYSGANTSTSITGLASGHYVYQVQACNDSGCSGLTTSSAVTVIPAPSASISVPASSFTASIPVSWQASSLANNYVLEEYPYSGGWGVAYDGVSTSDTVTVTGSGTYQFQVAACGAGGCSAYTTSGNVIVMLPPSLSASTTASISGTFSLSWNAVATATGYTLSQNGTSVYTGNETSWSANDLGNGSYTYTVQSCNAAGCGGASNPVTVSVNHIPAPSLSASTTSSSNGTFTLSWSTVPGATSYQLYQSGTSSPVYNASGTSWTSSSLPSGSYTYTVYGCNGSTCGFASNPVTVTVVPASAPSLSGPAWSTGSITLNWNAVAGATRYQLNQNLGGTVTVPYNANGTSWTSGSLANGNYAYQVFACNAGGCGPGSTVVTVFVSNQPPAAPTILSAPSPVTNDQPFVVTWSAIINATSYTLQQTSQENGTVKIRYTGPNTNSGTLYLGYPPNSYFIYVVQACNVEGCSAWSAPAYIYLNSGKIQAAPASGSSTP